ncbi:MAG: hypothetical protein ACI8W8_000368 [Rhodothermales bacterium]|jgi:hypothetical protein
MKSECQTARQQVAESATPENWEDWHTHAVDCDDCASAQKLMARVEHRGETGIGERRRTSVLAAARMRCSHRPLVAPILACLAAAVLSVGTIYLVCELRSPAPVTTAVAVENEPALVVPELPEDPFSAAFDSQAEALRNRVQIETEAPTRSDDVQQIRDRVKKLRAALAFDS